MRQTEAKKFIGQIENQSSGDLTAACLRYGCGRYTIERIAKAAGAKIVLGRRVLYNFRKMDGFLDEMGE